MDLDLMNYKLDHPEQFSETFIDEGFEAFEKGDSEEDVRASEVPSKALQSSQIPVDTWEDIPEEDL